MKYNRKVPITRVNKFFSQEDFNLEVNFGREWLEGDINIKVVLFQVDQGKAALTFKIIQSILLSSYRKSLENAA